MTKAPTLSSRGFDVGRDQSDFVVAGSSAVGLANQPAFYSPCGHLYTSGGDALNLSPIVARHKRQCGRDFFEFATRHSTKGTRHAAKAAAGSGEDTP